MQKYCREVEEILVRKPGFMVRRGILILALTFIVMMGGSWFIKYPEKLAAPVKFETIPSKGIHVFRGEITLSAEAVSIVKQGQSVAINLEDGSGATSVMIEGTVDTICPIGAGDYYSVLIRPSIGTPLPGIKGTVTIQTGERSILSDILSPVFSVFTNPDR